MNILIIAMMLGKLFLYQHQDIKDPELGRYIKNEVEENALPSIAVAILDSSGVKYLSLAGVRKKGGNTSATDQDLYHLGSNSKAMTSA